MASIAISLRPKFTCPCCGFSGLESPPYERMGNPPWKDHGSPPYWQTYGEASYSVCPCCGFEFGLEDEAPDPAKSVTFEEYLATWIADGCVWFQVELKPKNWDLAIQLKQAGISKPNV
jgi:hypothetical protein